MAWFRRLAYLLRQSQHEADLREEIETHRALRAAALEREGASRQHAADASRRALGNTLLARDDVRELWLGSWATWSQDIRYGLRGFRRNPAFTLAAVATLALGIGANTGIFAIVNAVLLRDVPAPASHELVSMAQTVHGAPALAADETFSTAEYFAYRDRARTLSGLAAHANARGEATLAGDTPRRVLGTLVSCNYFAVLQQPPALGRPFSTGDCEPGADLVVILAHDLWRSAFGGDPDVVGRTIQLNRQAVTIAGVAAEGTYNGSPFRSGDYFAPISAGQRLSDGDLRYGAAQWLFLLGRRRDGRSLAEVQAEIDVVAAQLDRQQPGRVTTVTVERAAPTLSRQGRGRATAAATVLMAAFGLILLIACANFANLLLARGASRSREIGIRVSLGASRGRVVRQLLTESVLISVVAGLVGSLAGLRVFQALLARAVPALLPPWGFPLALDLSADVHVISFAAALAIGTGILFGLAPALNVSTPDLQSTMTQRAAGSRGRHRGARLRGVLVATQVALCTILMIGAGLLVRGLYTSYTLDPRFSFRDVAFVSLESAFDGYSPEEAPVVRQRLVAGLAAVPGVEAVASVSQEPLGDDFSPVLLRRPGDREGQAREGEMVEVTPGYFDVLELPILSGRAFTEAEARNPRLSPRPAIVSTSTARNLWPGSDPLGQTLLSGGPAPDVPIETLQVVGVAADGYFNALGQVDPYYVYVPGDGATLLVKSRADMATTVAGIRRAVNAIDPTLALPVFPLEVMLGWSRGISATVSALFGGLGMLALALASVGIYGVVAFAVAGRRHEIGIRLTLGATPRGVLGLVLRQTLRPVAAGAAIGLLLASGFSRVLSAVLFGVSPADPFGFGGSVLFVIAAALAAATMAALPATQADPMATLRSE